jgi:hypothetical protein
MAKKLTKKQVQTKMLAVDRQLGILLSDKITHGADSFVPIGLQKMIDLAIKFQQARRKVITIGQAKRR